MKYWFRLYLGGKEYKFPNIICAIARSVLYDMAI